MRYVPILEPITLYNPLNNKPLVQVDDESPEGRDMDPLTMHRFLVMYVLAGQELKGYKDYKAVRAIDKIFSQAPAGGYAALEDDHWERLKRAVEHIALVSANLGGQLVPFMDAIMEAKSAPPKEDASPVRQLSPVAS